MEMDGGSDAGAGPSEDHIATGGLSVRRRKVPRVDESTGAARTTVFAPRAGCGLDRLPTVKHEPCLYDYDYEYDYDELFCYRPAANPFDYDDDRWPMHKVPGLPAKRRHTASSSAAVATATDAYLTRHASPAATRVDPVVPASSAPAPPAAASAAATPPNASPGAQTVPPAAVPAPASAAAIRSVPPNVGRPAPAATRIMPREYPYQRLAARRSTLLPCSVRPAGRCSSTNGVTWGSTAVVSAPKAVAAAALSSLGKYCQDMTAQAGKMDPVIGRDDEIDRVVCILCRRTKNSAMLVGAPGVGKTAIAEGLAQRIAAGAVPAALTGARVMEVDLGAMVAGTKYRGMFEERIKKVIEEAEAADGKVVLFIDEVHMLLGAGQSKDGSMDGANLLKPALARGRIRCIGATTFDEHRKHVEKDAAFERRFQKVHVQEPSMLATIAILQGLREKYEEHHGIKIQDATIVAAARLANRYITGRQFPDKAIDLIDEACATARMQADNLLKGCSIQHVSESAMKEAIVSPGQVAEVVSRWTGIPVNTLDQDEKEKLMRLADRLRERVVGQDAAVNMVAQAVLRSRAGLDQPGQPTGSFLFLGSTGVGKTELAKALAEQLFDSEKMLSRFDMTEFVGSHSVLRLIGAPPSYRGHEDGGQLTEKVRQRPYSVILFDEIEKADPAVFNVFLQLLDDGVLTDGKGRTVDFKNTISIMTSNLGAEYLMEAMAGETSMEAAHDLVVQQAQKHFKPEFLNRLSELVIFEPLSQDKLREVAKVQMKGIITRAGDKGITLSASDAVLDVILSESHNPFPDKAIDLIDEACANTRLKINSQREANAKKKAIVGFDQIAQVVSRWTGIPVTTLDQEEREKLIGLADRLHERVVGQDEAVNLVAQAVLRSRAGLDKRRQPIGSFLFLGTTGVGKTELAKALAEQLFDSEKMLVRFDMSEYIGPGSVLRLIGSPPGSNGHDDGGQLTEKIRRRPYSVILFDEVEKADSAVFNVFLQLLDDGLLTDGKGRAVDFKNTIIIMTSNLGAEHLAEAMTGARTMDAARGLVVKKVQRHFKPEFLNRLSEIVIFEPLSHDKLKEVVKIQMKDIVAGAADKGISLSTSDDDLDVILSESYHPMYGARPIRRWVQKNVMTRLSEMLRAVPTHDFHGRV